MKKLLASGSIFDRFLSILKRTNSFGVISATKLLLIDQC